MSNILATMSHAQLISLTFIKKLWTFFRRWGRDRSRVKKINPGPIFMKFCKRKIICIISKVRRFNM